VLPEEVLDDLRRFPGEDREGLVLISAMLRREPKKRH
jgi:hypothetical protein